MNSSLLKNLFHHKGSIDNKEFLYGLTIISFCTFVILNLEFVYTGLSTSMSWYWIAFHELTVQYIPVLPLRFIIFYLSIVLALKRVRSFSVNSALGFILGIFTFFFFITIVYLPNIVIFIFEPFGKSHSYEYAEYSAQINVVAIMYGVFLLIGLASVLYLLLVPPSDKKSSLKISHSFFTTKGKLNDFEYISHFGKLLLTSLLVELVIGIIFFAFRSSQEITKILLGVSAIPILILVILHIFISMRRARDIGLMGKSIPLGILAYLFIWASFGLWHYFDILPVIGLSIDFIVFVTVHSLYLFQMLLIILPSNLKNEFVNNPNFLRPVGLEND